MSDLYDHAAERSGVYRYAIATRRPEGWLQLFGAQQGRNTHPTVEAAAERLGVMLRNNHPNIIREFMLDRAVVVRVECYPGHHDPKGIYFNEADVVLDPNKESVNG